MLSVVNVVGVKEAAGLNIVLAVTDLATQLLLVIVGVVLVLSPHTLIHNVHLGVAPTWKNFLVAIPIGMIAYTGIETISNMAEEARDETKTIPKAIKAVVVAVFAIYAALPMVALSALPVHRQPDGSYTTLLGTDEAHGGFAGDPVLGIVKHLHLGALQHAGEIYVGLLAATILFIATNAGIIGVSRLVYSMGLHRQVPDRLRQLHPRFRTPWIGILLFGGVACLTMIPGQADFLGNMYAFGAMLSFTIAHLSVIRLRLSDPDRKRPYRGPGTLRVAGRELPLFAVLGILGTGLAFVVVTILHYRGRGRRGRVAGARDGRLHHLPATRGSTCAPPVARAPGAPADFAEFDYRTALVPIFGGDVSASALVPPEARLIGEDGGRVRDLGCPCRASCRLERRWSRGARARIESARIQARRDQDPHRPDPHAQPRRGAGRGSRTDRRRRHLLVRRSMRQRASSGSGRRATYLLSKRPCRVIIETENPGSPRARGPPVPA